MHLRRQASTGPDVSRRALIAAVALALALLSVGTVSAMTYYGGRLDRQERLQKRLLAEIAAVRRAQAEASPPLALAPPPRGRDQRSGRSRGELGPEAENELEALPGADGEDGVDGLDRLDGLDGAVGADGRPGVPGEKGEKGDSGEQGLQGIQGAIGPKGDKGDKGDTGDQGLQGLQGVQGEAGPKGDKGDKGDTGDQGIQGLQGVQGLQGLQGIQGEAGLKGDKGDTGDQGPPGIQGPQGIQGQAGPKGDKGDKGDPGDDGLDAPVDTDSTMAANSDTLVPSQKAVKTALAAKAAADLGTTRPFLVASGEWWLSTIGIATGYSSASPSSTTTNSNNYVRYAPFYLSQTTSVDGMTLNVTQANAGASAVLGLAIYDAHPTTGRPRNVVADAGTQSINSTGMKTMTFAPVSLPAGYYWAATTTRGLDTAGTNPAYAVNTATQSVGETTPTASNNMFPSIVGTQVTFPSANPTVSITRSVSSVLPAVWIRKG